MTSEIFDKKALLDIEKFGCHIIHVLEDETGPRFSYSIGIEKTLHIPELLVTGLAQDTAHWIINEYNTRVRNGESFEPDIMYAGFLDGFDVTFKPVMKKHYDEYFGWATWFYRNEDFRVYQLIWPSTQGIWPWDSNVSGRK